jgi:hypothetical protein
MGVKDECLFFVLGRRIKFGPGWDVCPHIRVRTMVEAVVDACLGESTQ